MLGKKLSGRRRPNLLWDLHTDENRYDASKVRATKKGEDRLLYREALAGNLMKYGEKET